MNPSAIIAARDTANALQDQASAATDALLNRIARDAELANETRKLIAQVYQQVLTGHRTIAARDVQAVFIPQLQPLAQSYGFTLSLHPDGSTVIITAN